MPHAQRFRPNNRLNASGIAILRKVLQCCCGNRRICCRRLLPLSARLVVRENNVLGLRENPPKRVAGIDYLQRMRRFNAVRQSLEQPFKSRGRQIDSLR